MSPLLTEEVPLLNLCGCVCVCVIERERKMNDGIGGENFVWILVYTCTLSKSYTESFLTNQMGDVVFCFVLFVIFWLFVVLLGFFLFFKFINCLKISTKERITLLFIRYVF